MNPVIRNLIFAVGLAVPVGAVVSTSTPAIKLPSPKAKILPKGPTVVTPAPGPFTSPPVYDPYGTSPGGPITGPVTTTSGGAVILGSNALCYPELGATDDLRNEVRNYRIGIGSPTTEDPRLDAVAQNDANNLIAVSFPNTTINGLTIAQRVQKAVPGAKAASEIIVKGCFLTGNFEPDVWQNQILATPSTFAIINNPNWNNFGAFVLEDPLFGGIIWIIIFAQE